MSAWCQQVDLGSLPDEVTFGDKSLAHVITGRLQIDP